MFKIYSYKQCSTCKKALQFLKNNGLEFREVAIRDTPPSIEELRFVLTMRGFDVKKLFNVSGQAYRALNMKDQLPGLSDDEALRLLSQNGHLVKRPFLVSDNLGLVGFNEEEWSQLIT